MDRIKHVAFIMDGNRRWARTHKLSLFLGHENGAKRIEPLVEHGIKKGITHMTFWAFSTENWQREKEEVKTLMEVFRQALHDPMVKRLRENNVRVQVIGDLTHFPQDIQEEVKKIVHDSEKNNRMIVNIALHYGGRSEIVNGINQMIENGEKNVTEELVDRYLYTRGQPDPDLIIRTGGEQRLSGYLPWQSVYSELYFTKILWPDFTAEAFDQALEEFSTRQRRFGK